MRQPDVNQCIFCEILQGRQPASFVFRDEMVAAFMDIQPVNPGHLLVIPICHAVGLEDLDGPTAAHLFRVAQHLAGAMRRSGIRCEGINLFLADGEAAFQEVFHVHLHVIPRFEGDGFGLTFAEDYHQRPPREELEALAVSISRGLKQLLEDVQR